MKKYEQIQESQMKPGSDKVDRRFTTICSSIATSNAFVVVLYILRIKFLLVQCKSGDDYSSSLPALEGSDPGYQRQSVSL